MAEETRKKSSDFFKVEGFKDGVLTLSIKLTKTDKASATGKTYVLGRAFGKLPYHVGGKQLRINASVMIPAEETTKNVEEITV